MICFLCVDVKYIFLVGGLSESPLFQQVTKREFGSRVHVLVPQEASLAVLKGIHPPVRPASRVLAPRAKTEFVAFKYQSNFCRRHQISLLKAVRRSRAHVAIVHNNHKIKYN